MKSIYYFRRLGTVFWSPDLMNHSKYFFLSVSVSFCMFLYSKDLSLLTWILEKFFCVGLGSICYLSGLDDVSIYNLKLLFMLSSNEKSIRLCKKLLNKLSFVKVNREQRRDVWMEDIYRVKCKNMYIELWIDHQPLFL